MRRIAVLALGILSFAANAEPIALQGLAPGMTKAQVEAAAPRFTAACGHSKHWDEGVEGCGYLPGRSEVGIPALATLGGAPVESWYVGLKNGVVTTIWVRLASADFDRVTAAFRERWGKPASEVSSKVQNRMGARFDQTETTWKADGSFLKVTRYADVTEGMGVYLTTDKIAREEGRDRREEPQAQDAK